MDEPWPYNLPIFRRSHREVSPDGSIVAEIAQAFEVSMSNPTVGTLRLSSGLQLDRCNPAFLWSDDSRYLAVPRYFTRFGIFRRQRLTVVDTRARRVAVSPEIAWYFQPESFTEGLLTVLKEPFHSARRVSWKVPEHLAGFKVLDVDWPEAAQPLR
jgi:hypothetical protein